MHESLRRRLMRAIESLPEDRVYQVLDYIEFLESRYGTRGEVEPGGLQRFAERLEDRIRARSSMSPANLREAFELLSTADRVLSTLSDVEATVRREASAAVRSSFGSTTEPPEPLPDAARLEVEVRPLDPALGSAVDREDERPPASEAKRSAHRRDEDAGGGDPRP